jgi:site-specific recombinase XerD
MLTYWWLRVQELCDLKINDILKNSQISIKWNKERIIKFKEDYMKIIKQYITLKTSLWIDSDYIFSSHSNNSLWNKLSRASVEEIVRKAWEKAWIWKIRPHKLRHTYAVQMLKNWEDSKTISKSLWYKNKQAAQRYFNHKISKFNNN